MQPHYAAAFRLRAGVARRSLTTMMLHDGSSPTMTAVAGRAFLVMLRKGQTCASVQGDYLSDCPAQSWAEC
jgi:hypothetical protein